MLKSLFIALLVAASAFAQAAPPEASSVPYPRSTTRDQLVISDYSFAPNVVGDFYTVPVYYDLYVQKIVSTMITRPDNLSFQEIMIRPPNESNAIYMWAGAGRHADDYGETGFLVPGGTHLARYYSQDTSSPVVYHAVTIIGILKPHDKAIWGF